jgi:hypothetical protein
MPQTHVVFYREDDGTVPVLQWFDDLPRDALGKCQVKIERLRELGHELRRPEADYLRDGIYECARPPAESELSHALLFSRHRGCGGFAWNREGATSSAQGN